MYILNIIYVKRCHYCDVRFSTQRNGPGKWSALCDACLLDAIR